MLGDSIQGQSGFTTTVVPETTLKIRSLLPFGFLFTLSLGLAGPIQADDGYLITPALRAELEKPRYFESTSSTEKFEQSKRRWKKAWIGSWIAFAAVNVLDAHSSQGHGEANPFLRDSNGGFANGKATAVKGALGAGFFLFQRHLVQRGPNRNYYKTFTIANTAATGAMGAVAANNYTLK